LGKIKGARAMRQNMSAHHAEEAPGVSGTAMMAAGIGEASAILPTYHDMGVTE
jgi:hypothetical protein